MSRSLPSNGILGTPRLQVDYAEPGTLDAWLARDDTLAAFGFGDDAPRSGDPRYLRVPLQPHGNGLLEVWRTHAPVERGREPAPAKAGGDIAWGRNAELSFGAIEVVEGEGGIIAAAEHAYARLARFIADSRTPHLLRIWNYIDAITEGEGDAERYRQFCVGRARGLGTFDAQTLPAATAIGRCDADRVIQIYWLASAVPGTPVENPRQVSAYRYPPRYGPTPPSFARALRYHTAGGSLLFISGTASVVAHRSLHPGQLGAQLRETLANLDALLIQAPAGQPNFLKVFLRDPRRLTEARAALGHWATPSVPILYLRADVCRRELEVEIEGVCSR